jgi:hypothetical protein
MYSVTDRYAWADTAYDLAWTVAVIQGRAEREAVAAYGGSVKTMIGRLAFETANTKRIERMGEYGVLQIKAIDDSAVAIEPNGWTGNVPAVARRLSISGGYFFSVYWSPSAFQILQAHDGQVTGLFDPNFVGLPAGANDMLPGWVADHTFPLAHLKSACLAALEQQTGLAFDQDWLSEPLPTYGIPA